MHKPHELVVTVVILLAYGCPTQAIVAAFGLDESTVSRWQNRRADQCRRLHEHIVQAGEVLLGHVQADELRVRVVGGAMWLASAMSVSSRLWWLGGLVQIRRDRSLIRALLLCVRSCGAFQGLLLCKRWALELPQAGARSVARASSHRQARASPASLAEGPHGRPSGQEARPPKGDRGSSARHPWHGGGGGTAAESHSGYCHGGDQHRLQHRAASGHLALPACHAGAQDSCGGEPEGDGLRRACGWSGRPTTSAGRIAVCACRARAPGRGSGSNAPRLGPRGAHRSVLVAS